MADGGRDGLTSTEYERVCRATETYREELVVELCGRVGLRPSEIARLRPSALTRREFDGAEHYFLDVPDGDGGPGGRTSRWTSRTPSRSTSR
ncbi:hypothetical protein [Halospeciosus flavus]|uniref:hypothetical protein n=1 Tax=Halospeciosus flavus TaxID=3032283 RepID=UPI00361BFA2D